MELVEKLGQPVPYSEAQMDSTRDFTALARSGDSEAFRLIFDRYSRPVLSFIYDMIGRRELAEELTQETFVRAYKGLSSLRDGTKLSTWLFGIAKNVARESLRSRSRDSSRVEIDQVPVDGLKDHRPSPDNAMLNRELNGVIKNALDGLDEDKKTVFTLKVFHHQSYEEIAQITGFSISKLKTDLHRAKAEMRRQIGPYLEMSHEL